MTTSTTQETKNWVPTPTLPTMDLKVSRDGMQASLDFRPTPKSQEISEEDIRGFLESKGVVFGVSEGAVLDLVNLWNKTKKTITEFPIAFGMPPEIQQNLIQAPCIYRPDHMLKLKKMDVRHIHLLKKLDSDIAVVAKEASILTLANPVAKLDGTNVYGQVVVKAYPSFEEYSKGSGVVLDEKEKVFRSSVEGVVTFMDGTLDVVPVIRTSYFHIGIEANKMKALLTIYPSEEGKGELDLGAVKENIKSLGIKYGLREDIIPKLIEQVSQKKEILSDTLAEGKPSVNGRDGYVEHLLDYHSFLKPKISEDGTADFKNISLIKPVKTGDVMARYHSPTPGVEGITVFSEPLLARDGVDIKLPLGFNTAVSKEDPSKIIATLDGNAKLNGNLVEVSECYTVDGDVDYSTGNVQHLKTVIIRGDVKSGFNVSAGGDLEVTGIVEDCKIITKGSVLVKAGFLGNGQGEIDSQGDVGIGFIRNQIVRSRRNITIVGEAMNSQLLSRRNIEVKGKTLGIVGGSAKARFEIQCETAGNETGTKTHLQVGVDYALFEEKFKTEEKISELNASRKKIQIHLDKLIKIKSSRGSLPEKESLLLKKLVDMQTKITQQLRSLEERKSLIIEKLSEVGSAKVLIGRMIYPGVTISVGEVFFTVRIRREGPLIYMIKNGAVISV